MRRDVDLLKAEADERASMVGRCWVEKLEIQCQPPSVVQIDARDPLTELRRLIADEVAGSDAFKAAAFEVAEELRGQLPPECRHILGEEETAFDLVVADLLDEGADNVVARLHADSDAEAA
jgi:exonuclease SbcD